MTIVLDKCVCVFAANSNQSSVHVHMC